MQLRDWLAVACVAMCGLTIVSAFDSTEIRMLEDERKLLASKQPPDWIFQCQMPTIGYTAGSRTSALTIQRECLWSGSASEPHSHSSDSAELLRPRPSSASARGPPLQARPSFVSVVPQARPSSDLADRPDPRWSASVAPRVPLHSFDSVESRSVPLRSSLQMKRRLQYSKYLWKRRSLELVYISYCSPTK